MGVIGDAHVDGAVEGDAIDGDVVSGTGHAGGAGDDRHNGGRGEEFLQLSSPAKSAALIANARAIDMQISNPAAEDQV
jgi:hypothetical protein